MGLTHPTDLDAWQAWQRKRHRLRTLRHLGRSDQPQFDLLTDSTTPRVLIAVQSTNSSSRAALLDVADRLDRDDLALLVPRGLDVPGNTARRIPVDTTTATMEALTSVTAVLSLGHYLSTGAEAFAWAQQRDVPFFVAQHGLLTPHAPPLPPGCTLLAWSQADADYWRSGRTDIDVQVVGSQLLWHAARRTQVPIDPTASPTFLGQLHGAEIPRRDMARVSYQFCRDHDATYRPHPSEVDKLSRLQHEVWKRRGVRFDNGSRPLADLPTPIVGVFSTGLLEAAAAGHPAYTYHPDPPPWVAELWDRYGLEPWGSGPTPAPAQPDVEPAQAIAALLTAG